MFDCLSFVGLTQLQQQQKIYLAQSTSTKLFIIHFLFKPPHFLKILSEIPLHEIRKTTKLSFGVVIYLRYMFSIVGHNST
jgi:hypothetical protein